MTTQANVKYAEITETLKSEYKSFLESNLKFKGSLDGWLTEFENDIAIAAEKGNDPDYRIELSSSYSESGNPECFSFLGKIIEIEEDEFSVFYYYSDFEIENGITTVDQHIKPVKKLNTLSELESYQTQEPFLKYEFQDDKFQAITKHSDFLCLSGARFEYNPCDRYALDIHLTDEQNLQLIENCELCDIIGTSGLVLFLKNSNRQSVKYYIGFHSIEKRTLRLSCC